MATAGRGQGFDPDDWFDEPEVPDAWTTRVDRLVRERQGRDEPAVDDWMAETAAPPRVRRQGPQLPTRGVVVVAVLGLCLLLGILAAAGVFSGGGRQASTLSVTTPPTQRTPTTTATPAAKPPPAVPTATLKPGATGTAVAQLQRALARAGYSPGAADGAYGPGTTDAVKRFQQAKGLTADGVAGPQTLAALRTLLQGG